MELWGWKFELFKWHNKVMCYIFQKHSCEKNKDWLPLISSITQSTPNLRLTRPLRSKANSKIYCPKRKKKHGAPNGIWLKICAWLCSWTTTRTSSGANPDENHSKYTKDCLKFSPGALPASAAADTRKSWRHQRISARPKGVLSSRQENWHTKENILFSLSSWKVIITYKNWMSNEESIGAPHPCQ